MFHIDYEGQWFHDGEIIHRKTLKKLLSEKALAVDNQGRYWLKTSHEKYAVTVEDAPYVIVDFRIRKPGTPEQVIYLLTNLDEKLVLNEEKRLFLKPEVRQKLPVPYVEVRYGLMARMNRAVLVDLMNKALETQKENVSNPLTILSGTYEHPLGIPENA